ncbi:hypothetical protein GQ457_02G018860 [Hibiscus cannabinus]
MDVGGGDFDGPTQGTTLVAGDDVMVCNGFGLEGGVGGVQSKPTSRDMLTGRMIVSSVGLSIPDLDVDMEDEDVQITSMDGTPMINFLDRVHSIVDDKLAKLVIVRLLGRSIGNNMLLNRIRALRNPSGEIAMVDLDNGYYFGQFYPRE